MQKIFDTHTHIFPDKVAPSAVDTIAGASGVKPAYDGTRAGLARCLADNNIAGALNCPIATKPEQVDSISQWAVDQNRWPVLSLGGMHPDYEDKEGMLSDIKTKGLAGIKMHPEYQSFRLDEDRVKKVWDTCQELGLIVFLHAGADIAFEPPYHSRPGDFAWLVREFPRLQVVAAHLGGWRMWNEVEEELLGLEIYLETSFSLGMMPDPALGKRILLNHSRDMLMFGSDGPWGNPADELERVNSLGLPEEVKNRLLWDNAERLFRFCRD